VLKDFRILDRLVKPDLNRVVFGERAVQVEPKMMQVLVRLAEAPGRVVSREELQRDVWNGTHVTDDVLTRCISELRKLFEDDARRPRVIETIVPAYRICRPPKSSRMLRRHSSFPLASSRQRRSPSVPRA
jgi:DNA-binding winged helix-turn-helix (wHTH) protein